MKNKLIVSFGTLAMAAALLGGCAGENSDGVLLYKEVAGGYEVVGTSLPDRAFYFNVEIPETFNDKPVVSVGEKAFYGCPNITSVKFNKNIKHIGKAAFAFCIGLEKTSDTESVTSVDESAFYYCSRLEVFSAGDTLETIGKQAFYNCASLKEFKFNDNITEIPEYAFYNCFALTSVDVKNGVETIGDYAFSKCANVTEFKLNDDIEEIGKFAFSYCTKLESFKLPVDVVEIKEGTFFDDRAMASIEIGDSITEIGDSAFYSCISLTELELPFTLQKIGKDAFTSCNNLATINLGFINFATYHAIEGKENFVGEVHLRDDEPFDVNNFIIPALAEGENPVEFTAYDFKNLVGVETVAFEYSADQASKVKGKQHFTGKYELLDGGQSVEAITLSYEAGIEAVDYTFYNFKDLKSVTLTYQAPEEGKPEKFMIRNHMFDGCENLETITFSGTASEWKKLTKGVSWAKGIKAQVVACSDENVNI